jgi:hypothetical protein
MNLATDATTTQSVINFDEVADTVIVTPSTAARSRCRGGT